MKRRTGAMSEYTWRSAIRDFLVSLVVLMILFHTVLGISLVRGVSMEETIHDGTVVFFQRIVGQYRIGDVVAARIPTGELYVKRIVARGGDVVDLKDGAVYVNGQLENACPAHGQSLQENDTVTFPYQVPEGSFFLMGDNREHSRDSRWFGALPEENLKGRLFGY